MQEPMEQWIRELLESSEADGKMTEKQGRIMEAAIEVFSEKGFAASSTSEIAQRAGVAEGTIFRHYKTKKDLLLAIVAPFMAKIVTPFVLRDFAHVLDSRYERLDDFLRAFIFNRIDFLEKHMNLVKIFVQEVPFQPQLQEQFKKIVVGAVLSRIRPIMERFRESGDIGDMPTERAIRFIFSSVLGYVMIRTFHGLQAGEAWDDELEREETIAFIQRGLRSGG